MTTTTFTLKHPDIVALDRVGLRLPGLANTKWLAAGSRIEGPTSIISTVAQTAFLDVGAFCNLSGGSINNVRFGRYCSVAADVVIGPHEHPTDWLTTSRAGYYPEVNGWNDIAAAGRWDEIRRGLRLFQGACPITTIGHDVWIGQGAFVKAGVTIGTGSIIGARAMVLCDVAPYSVVVGMPARVIRLRFPEALVARLLMIEWWRYSIYDLFAAPFDDVEAALDRIEEMVAAGLVSPYAGPVITPADLADPQGLAADMAMRLTPPLAQAS